MDIRLVGFLHIMCAVLFLAGCVYVLPVSAFSDAVTTIASPIPVSGGEVGDGMIISYVATDKTYKATDAVFDENMFGVVVNDPVLYMRETGTGTKMYPVVRFGEAHVLVSEVNGSVQPGDLVTGSHVRGVGQRLDREQSGYMLGYALDEVVYDDPPAVVTLDGKQVRIGKVLLALRIGAYTPPQDEDVEQSGDNQDGITPVVGHVEEDNGSGFDAFLFFRYLLGAFVAIVAVVLALRRFGDLFAQSIVSVGRNPLARSQIRSIMVWNAVLIVIVSGVGLGIGVAIIVL